MTHEVPNDGIGVVLYQQMECLKYGCTLHIIHDHFHGSVQFSYRAVLAWMCPGAYCVRVVYCDILNSLAIGWFNIVSVVKYSVRGDPRKLGDTAFPREIVRVRLPGKWEDMQAAPDVQQSQTWEKCRDLLACVCN